MLLEKRLGCEPGAIATSRLYGRWHHSSTNLLAAIDLSKNLVLQLVVVDFLHRKFFVRNIHSSSKN